MRLSVNGEEAEFNDGMTLGDLLRNLKLVSGRLACEVNREIVRRADYDKTVLKEEDEIEIVQMIGGG
jgi:sulfur carrier protein